MQNFIIFFRSFKKFAWWGHDMETLSSSLALCEGNPLLTSGFLNKGPVMQSFDIFLYSQPQQSVEQTVKLLVIREAITLMWHHFNVSMMRFGVSTRDLMVIMPPQEAVSKHIHRRGRIWTIKHLHIQANIPPWKKNMRQNYNKSFSWML